MDAIRHFFSQLFTQLNTEDSWTVIGMLLGTFLIGLITNYFLNRNRVALLETSLENSVRDKDQLKIQFSNLKDQHALKEADLKKANLEISDKKRAFERIDAEKRALHSRLNASLLELEKHKDEFQEATNRLEDLNDQILGLRTKNAQLIKDLEQGGGAGIGAFRQYEQKITNLTAENSLLKTSIEEFKSGNFAEGTAEATVKVAELEKEIESLKNQLFDKQKPVVDPDINALEEKITLLEAEQTKWEETRASISQLEAGNEILNNTIAKLIEENEKLKDSAGELPPYEAGNEALHKSMEQLIIENEALRTQKEEVIQYESGNAVLNTTIRTLIEKNLELEETIRTGMKNQVEWSLDDPVEDNEADPELNVEDAKARIRTAIGHQIASASVDKRDDLKQINGIGPFIEEKLNDLGIFTFEQISQLDDELVSVLTSAIEFFSGRIDRDDWVGQADRLLYTQGDTPEEMSEASKIITKRYATATEKIETTPASFTNTPKVTNIPPDDLKKIEGIGPKIAEILNQAGIHTYLNLADCSPDQLKDILSAAGNRFKMHDPTTWPQQSALAAAGEWDKLTEYQNYLDGGKDTAKS